jgi:ubiquinone/menaquinone biosynthesis C-methylase UbiE
MIEGARTKAERQIDSMRQTDIQPYLDIGSPLRILDIANGRLRPQYTLLRAAGHHVYGVDYVNRPRKTHTDRAYDVARYMYAWRLGLDHEYTRATSLICSDVGQLPFPNQYFDLAISAAAFEHFLDVPAVVAEVSRVLRPGGMVWVSIHLFTSPSGGHNLSFTEFPLQTMPPGVEPWDHLRRRRLPFTVPLNEWRKHQYLETFGRHFEIIKTYCAFREGQQWLTPDVRAALAGYSEEELTCGALVIVARKPAG